MPRAARIIIPDIPYHITQRGVNRQEVFLADEERQRYLALLRRFADAQGLYVLGYCLMINHIHLAGIPRQESEIDDDLLQLRHWTHTGRPLGDEAFITRLGQCLGRRVQPLRVGRPCKEGTK